MLTITDAASRKLDEILHQPGEPGSQPYGLRISAAPGCCSGAHYGLSLAGKLEPGDWEGEFGGVKVLVDAESAPFLKGASIDYVETPEGSGFTVKNLNAAAKPEGGCDSGCDSGCCG
jgi:iron-sulfur cluster assembly accessory protein